QLGDVSAVVPDVGVPRDEPEKDAFAAPTNQDGRMRALDGLRQAAGLAQPVVLAREGSALLAPEELLHAERLVELGETHADGRELVAVALVLALVPAAPDAVDQAAAGEHVDGRRHLRDQGWRPRGRYSTGAMSSDFDVVVIGSGPAGEKAAMQAAKLRRRVAVVERPGRLGGNCLHTATIPSKTLRETILYVAGVKQRSLYAIQTTLRKDLTVN